MLHIKTADGEYDTDETQKANMVSDGILNDIAAMEFPGKNIHDFDQFMSSVFDEFGGKLKDDVDVDDWHRACEKVAADYSEPDGDEDAA